jgi:hypothetical protein
MTRASTTRRTRASQRRLEREQTTVRTMLEMFCRDHHPGAAGLCERCETLWRYAQARVERCPFRMDKPTCLACPVHCYQADPRAQIRTVMRYAGPRMPWRHPILSLLHFVDAQARHAFSSRRPA